MVLAIGGDPARPYDVSPWEHWFAAEPHLQRGDYDCAVAVMREGLPEHEGNLNLHWQLACALSLGGRHEEAVDHLRRAFDAAREKIVAWAADDPDLNPIRGRDDYPIVGSR